MHFSIVRTSNDIGKLIYDKKFCFLFCVLRPKNYVSDLKSMLTQQNRYSPMVWCAFSKKENITSKSNLYLRKIGSDNNIIVIVWRRAVEKCVNPIRFGRIFWGASRYFWGFPTIIGLARCLESSQKNIDLYTLVYFFFCFHVGAMIHVQRIWKTNTTEVYPKIIALPNSYLMFVNFSITTLG